MNTTDDEVAPVIAQLGALAGEVAPGAGAMYTPGEVFAWARSWAIAGALIDWVVGNWSYLPPVTSVLIAGTWLSAPIAPVTQVLTCSTFSSSPQRRPVTPDSGAG